VDRYIIFGILSILIILVSWRTLFKIKSHGFYRFLSWECIAWLLATNYISWFVNPFGFEQIISWIFLLFSGFMVIVGLIQMKRVGKAINSRNNKTLYQFEQTAVLIDTGIFKYIRHPLYSSLLLLTWGIFLKDTATDLLIVSILSTIFLYLTAIFDEKESISFFGEEYKEYMRRSKMFIPFIF